MQRDAAEVARESRAPADAARGRVHLAKRGIRATPKALRIATQLLAIAGRYRLLQARADALGGNTDDHVRRVHESCAAALRAVCEEHRGALLKLGQFLSMRPDILPAAYIRHLSQLQEHVPPLPLEELRGSIEEAIGAPLDEVFLTVAEPATSAASLAQVHHARGKDGNQYAIKVQVPGAREEALADIAILRALAASARFDSLPFDVKTTLAELARSIREELDYQAEARHMNELREALRGFPGVCIPAHREDLSSASVIVMEWKEGTALGRYLVDATTERKRQVLTRLLQCFMRQIFELGHVHADPHAGNLRIRESDDAPEGFELILLDFGCCAKFSDEVRQSYIRLLFGLFSGRRDAVLEELQALGFSQAQGDGTDLAILAETMLEPLQREGAIAAWAANPRAGAQALIEAMQNVPSVQAPPHFVLLGRVLSTLGGILIAHPEADVSLPALLVAELSRAQSSSAR